MITGLVIEDSRLNQIECENFEYASKLKNLHIVKNSIRNLKNDVFSKLHNLEHLNLHSNMLSDIEKFAFKNLSRLRVVDFRVNKLSKFEEDTFEGLSALEEILLDMNEIKILDRKYFYKNHNLRLISLRNNQIFAILTTFFDDVNSLIQVNLQLNDCTNYNFMNFQDHLDTLETDLDECFSNYKDVKHFDEEIETKLHFLKEIHTYFVDVLDDDILELQVKNENLSDAIVFLSNFQVFAVFMLIILLMFTTYTSCRLNRETGLLRERLQALDHRRNF